MSSFRVRMTLLFGTLGLVATLPVFFYVEHVLSKQLVDDYGRSVLDVASSTATVLAENLNERRREVEQLAGSLLFRDYALNDPEVRKAVDSLQDSYPSYSWIGVTSPDGIVLSSSDGVLTGGNVSKRPWFIGGRNGTTLGDVHEALLLAKLLKSEGAGPMRFIDVAAPIFDRAGLLRGVLGTHMHWQWSDAVIRRVQPADAKVHGLQIMIVNTGGDVLYPETMATDTAVPAVLRSGRGYHVGKWNNDVEYVAAAAPVGSDALIGSLGWRVVVRQPSEVVLQPVHAMRKTFIIVGIVSGVTFIALVLWLSATLSRPLERVAAHARRIESGDEEHTLEVRSGTLEIRRLVDALRGMTGTLIRRRQELADANQTLERKVQERTAALEEANAALANLARSDALTGLDNRLSANERLHAEWTAFQHTSYPYAVMLMDIDFFKRINDSWGHDVGDDVLQCVGATLQAALRKTDFVARFGGEEFLVLLAGVDEYEAVRLAEKLRGTIARTQMPTVGSLTMSIGVTMARTTDVTEEDALKRADEQLYRAKHAGRNQVAAA